MTVQQIHQLPGWPNLHWDQKALDPNLSNLRHKQGRLIGRMEGLGFSLRQEAELKTMTLEVIKSSEIEGDILDAEQVRSSIARRLGMDIAGAVPSDRHVEGVVEMMLDATQNYDKPIIAERLFRWHAALFPTGRSGMLKIKVGTWRDDEKGPMQVVSGPLGRERVHYEAPAAHLVNGQMNEFMDWVNRPGEIDPVLKAGLAHFWFVTIHPFDDGNGRIARAISDWALTRSENSSQRFYSMSAQIQLERNAYYDILEKTQKGSLDITPWMSWFLGCLERAIDGAEKVLADILRKARFWDTHSRGKFNQRQRIVLNRLLDGMTGKLTSSKWARLVDCSQDTAHRDIQDLVEQDILVKDAAGGRSTSYSLKEV